jgi:hypothetical protein
MEPPIRYTLFSLAACESALVVSPSGIGSEYSGKYLTPYGLLKHSFDSNKKMNNSYSGLNSYLQNRTYFTGNEIIFASLFAAILMNSTARLIFSCLFAVTNN